VTEHLDEPRRQDRFDAPRNADELGEALRQMIAVLEEERQALATLDADGLISASHTKEALCNALDPITAQNLDATTRPLAQTAQQLNEVNRQVRNLLAANVSARLDALGLTRGGYRASRRAQL